MDPEGEESDGSSYYGVLGIGRSASASEIRSAYRKLALKWHPDRWMTKDSSVAGDAKRRFQLIQEAYSVLSDNGKRSLYDVGLYDPFEEEDEGFSDFMQEMLSMMDSVRSKEEDSLEDLQNMFAEMVEGQGMALAGGVQGGARRGTTDASKRSRVGASQGRAAKRSTSRATKPGFGGGIFC